MKNILYVSIMFVAMFGLNSCSKAEISTENQDFIGSWYSEYNDLYIGESGTGTFNRQKGTFSSYIDGRVKITDKKVIFSSGIISKGLKINTRPHETTLGWEMELKDEIYYRY